jgi:hypothetical protein
VHFVGDLHQPLHDEDNGDRGGNERGVATLGSTEVRDTIVLNEGFVFREPGHYEKGLRRALADGRQYYLLAYHSSNRAADGKFRTLSVHVKGKNLVVRHKPGYWGPLASTFVAAATRAEPSTPASVPAAPGSAGNLPAVPPTNLSEPSFTAVRSPSLLEILASEVAREVPDLKKLQPAANQDLLPSILQKVGANVDTFFGTFPNISCRHRPRLLSLRKSASKAWPHHSRSPARFKWKRD